ncbi:MAG: hypothetical protein AVDCRST_MAG17-1582 [uncultured Solirubrobacterales bacterium]|uniref:Alkaline phosphatase n=1 Tax=uncultured Solirubrobacterales bacterium TaxID=768556 RepID=A0A6J4STH2_9ACTN|nr:MAG: hypothetical protein AVDCRST_MAG17-1582 [uncultured Solirubrobacterales bacterium]
MGLRGRALALAAVFATLGVLAPSAFAQGSVSRPPPPMGANDACTSGQDPTPVVLVHGTFSNRGQFWKFSPQLEAAGHCVFALNYGCEGPSFSCGRGPIERSARQLRDFIDDRVLPQSRSGKVSILGHSQGGLMPRFYIKFLGGRTKVKDMVSISASNHGTDNPLAPFSRDCAACLQQSPYMNGFTRRINNPDETLGAIDYTQVQTRFDDVVFPYFSAFLADDPDTDYNGQQTRRLNGPRTANVCLQDRFAASTDDHLSITFSDQALIVIREALDRNGPARVLRPDSVCARLGGDPGGGGSRGGSNGRPACTITGTSRNDVLVGTRGADVICAGAGNDVVRADHGDDTVHGGAGNDTLRGNDGVDRLFGEADRDAVNSSDGVRGNDSADGGAGRDVCNGDEGDGRANCP